MKEIKYLTPEEFAETMLEETDRLFLLDLKVGTPEYNLQQGLMKGAARYRTMKKEGENV